MEPSIVYISLKESSLIHKKVPKIKDVATVLCKNNNLKKEIEDISLPMSMSNDKTQEVISFLKLIELITNKFEHVMVTPMGPQETIVYYKDINEKKPIAEKIKAIFLIFLAFLGTGYSIMSYNGDVATSSLLRNLYELFTGNTATGSSRGVLYGIIAYSAGLCIGMIIFFNHGIAKNSADDPTPLQVQMRLYEQDVNTCITVDSARKKEIIDVD